MFEIKVTLDATARLESAVYRLAEALSGSQIIDAVAPAAPVVPTVPAANVPTTPAPAPAPAPVQPAPAPAPAPVPVAPAPAVPVAQTVAPTYTKEQVAAAGAALIQARPETRDALIGLLTQFGVNAINNLPDAQLGAFATALRQLGANI